MGNRILMTLLGIFIGLWLCYLGDIAIGNSHHGLGIGFYIGAGIIGFGGPCAALVDYLGDLPKDN
jgi:hypothetical protein